MQKTTSYPRNWGGASRLMRVAWVWGSLLCSGLSLQAQQASSALPIIPADFPKYENTGNTEQDQKRYTEAKNLWIQQNPEAYTQIMKARSEQLAANPNLPSPTNTRQILSKWQFDQFPQERQSYILAHPELYEVREKTTISRKEVEHLSAEKVAEIKARPDLYEIIE